MEKIFISKKKEEAPEPLPSEDPGPVAVMLCRFPGRTCIHHFWQEGEVLCLAENRRARRAAICGKGAKS
jgi:hypothetical protein